jgi:hypothetical protein
MPRYSNPGGGGESSGSGTIYLHIRVTADSEDVVVGTGVCKFRMPCAMTLTEIRASVSTAPTGSSIELNVQESAGGGISDTIEIDATEKTSQTAAGLPFAITDANLADDAEMQIDVVSKGSTIPGKGLIVTLIGTEA